MKAQQLLAWVSCLACLVWCARTQSQDAAPVYTVAVYAPGLAFGDSMAKVKFIDSVARGLSQRTGLSVRGKAFARAGDLQAQSQAGKIDFAVLGGAYYASTGLGKVVAQGAGQEQMVLAGRAGVAGDNLASWKGKRLMLPPPMNLYAGYVSATALGHQAKTKDFFKVQAIKDTVSAMDSVKLGKADLTVTFASYARAQGLQIIHTGGPAPMPVAVQLNSQLDPDVASRFASAFQGLVVSGGGVLRGFGSGNPGLKSFRGRALSRPKASKPVMADSPRVRMNFSEDAGRPWTQLGHAPLPSLAPAPALPQEEAP